MISQRQQLPNESTPRVLTVQELGTMRDLVRAGNRPGPDPGRGHYNPGGA
ncbi:MAG: hypothetical protein U5O16_08900 [Rhodococcus sp. (in: high G+C Gram-positive bacteria)]|nr:hypothetical protein [Rhodococcus sp. (in: high G+C Gram-positive bacteria)]